MFAVIIMAATNRRGLLGKGNRGFYSTKCVAGALLVVWLESPECVCVSGTSSPWPALLWRWWLLSHGFVLCVDESCKPTHGGKGRVWCLICITSRCLLTDLWCYFSPEERVPLARFSASWKTKQNMFLFKQTLMLWWECGVFCLFALFCLEKVCFIIYNQNGMGEGRVLMMGSEPVKTPEDTWTHRAQGSVLL